MKNRLTWSNFKSSKTYIILIGLSASVWFLIRVIPKPSRASYPCMKAAAPLMSTFVIYLVAMSASMFTFKRFKQSVQSSKYLLASLFLLLFIISFGFIFLNDSKETIANALKPTDNTFPIASNTPIGEAKGLFPGRVVWVHDNGATNENYKPSTAGKDLWYSNNNANEAVIKEMLRSAILAYSGTDNIQDAWDAIFKSFNSAHGRGEVGYVAGEKIAFKINLTNTGLTKDRMNAAPQLLNAILHELVDNAGVAQSDITMGDPYRSFSKEYVDLVMSEYPDVYYVGGSAGNGVHQTIPSVDAVLKFSNKEIESTLPQQYLDATYVINIPCLKTHNDGGITLIAKNHQGSFLEKGDDPKGQYAIKMHAYLPTSSRGSGKYRHTVDYMGHEQTGGKGLIYIIDGLWAGESWEGYIKKFKSAPFNDDYPNSLFIGQDPVALESVGYDVLFEEYQQDASKQNYPNQLKVEIADYLSQCASSDYWPVGLQYDPEGDGTIMGSLGVFEHWNNATDRQYSRNLGTGDGVELKYIETNTINLTVLDKNLTISAGANSTETFDIISNTSWNAVVDQSWVTLSSSSGSNNATITVTAEENVNAEVRTATVTVTGTGVPEQVISITQEGVTNILSNTENNINIASPNPFSNYTQFKKPEQVSSNADLNIYNTKGELIKSLNFSGSNTIQWNGTNSENTDIANGLYIYKISDKSNNSILVGKVILKR